jgi:gliding motility-associated lipoprotein GldH
MNEINNLWNKNQEQKFVLNIEDTQNPKNIIFVVRNNNDYPYSNLFLITYLKKKRIKCENRYA